MEACTQYLRVCVLQFCINQCIPAVSFAIPQFIGAAGWRSNMLPPTVTDIISEGAYMPFLIIIITLTVGGYNGDLFIFHSASSAGCASGSCEMELGINVFLLSGFMIVLGLFLYRVISTVRAVAGSWTFKVWTFKHQLITIDSLTANDNVGKYCVMQINVLVLNKWVNMHTNEATMK